jgi:hypothetical protein
LPFLLDRVCISTLTERPNAAVLPDGNDHPSFTREVMVQRVESHPLAVPVPGPNGLARRRRPQLTQR